jgi:hypothetical protein
MIIKGSSRGGASQLGPYLLSTAKNTRAELIDLQSPLADLTESLMDWQTLADGTKQGKKGLYHAQIAQHGRYEMTRDQWMHSVDVLAEELGLAGQPRAVILHEKDGKEHLHVVWQRTDLETMKFVSDSNNYQAHERASQRLEKEFGHEEVPGKHAKRQKKEKVPTDAAQIEKDAALKEDIARLYEQSDNAQAFQTALEQEGYILAKGDRRPHIIVDADGKEHSLTRCLPDVDNKDIKQFMTGIDRQTLPTVDEAKTLQQEAAARPAEKKPEKQDQPPPQEEPNAPEEPKKTDEPPEPPKPKEPSKEKPDRFAEHRAKLEAALHDRHAAETRQLHEQQNIEQKRRAATIDRLAAENLYEFDLLEKAELDQYDRQHTSQRGRLATIIAAVRAWLHPAKEEEEQRQRQLGRDQFVATQQRHRDETIAAAAVTAHKESVALAATHARQLLDHHHHFEEERTRYLQEQERAFRIREADEVRRHQEEFNRQPPKPPPDSSL